ncbi:hypothetical protein HMPREF1870_01853, partial [Bacteroidales bacterium KA00344]
MFMHFGVYSDSSVLVLTSDFETLGTINYIDKTSLKFRLFENKFAF